MSASTSKKAANADKKKEKASKSQQETQSGRPLNPNEVAQLVLMQLNDINGKKDDLTIAIKGLSDLTQKLTQAYGEQTSIIQKLTQRVEELEAKK